MCADEADAVGPDDGGGSLGGESHKEPGGEIGCAGHHPDAQLADDHVTGVDVVVQNLPRPHGQIYAVQHGGVGQGQGGQVNVHGWPAGPKSPQYDDGHHVAEGAEEKDEGGADFAKPASVQTVCDDRDGFQDCLIVIWDCCTIWGRDGDGGGSGGVCW